MPTISKTHPKIRLEPEKWTKHIQKSKIILKHIKTWNISIKTSQKKSSRPETLTPKLRSGQSHRHRGVCRQGQFRQSQGVAVFTAVFMGNLRGKQGAKSWANLTPDGSFLGIIIHRNMMKYVYMFVWNLHMFRKEPENNIPPTWRPWPWVVFFATFPFSSVLRGPIRRTTARVKGSLDLTERPAGSTWLIS